jgi:hypothetical protein
VEQATLQGTDPLAVLPDFAAEHFLAWDDDSGPGYAAAFSLQIPTDGSYQLLVVDSPFRDTIGDYRMLIGIDTPGVLTGKAVPTDHTLVFPQETSIQSNVAVQELIGSLVPEKKSSTYFAVDDMQSGDTLYAYLETSSGDLVPVLVLYDYGDKPVASGNFGGKNHSASLQYTFKEDGRDYRLRLQSGQPEFAESEYRLLVGRNAPQVLDGEAERTGQAILRAPIDVQIGVRLQQITDVNQTAENFSAVVSVRMEWNDPLLVFSPDSCNCRVKTFTQKDFDDFIALTGGRWPEFTLFNQQGNRWIQNRLAVVRPEGNVIYFERFTTTFQVPDFDFRRFPFDIQQFYIRLDAIFPEEEMVFSDLESFTGLGSQLGEEEFYVTRFDTQIASETATTGNPTSRYSYQFEARRHLLFYMVRIFVPLFLIIIVAWITFFIRDYGKRIEAATANLLLFIAFNFTIGSDLPRLGYLTFLDSILIAAFVISVMVVAYNVYLKRLEVAERRPRAEQIDRYAIWLYPITYILAFGLVALAFFVWS